jgi:hypothetical protein
VDIYRERSHLLALLACHYPSHIVPVTDPEPGFAYAVCIHIGGKQHAWHISDDDLFFFEELPRSDSHYDGHSTDQKYDSLWRYTIDFRQLLGHG